MILVTKGKGIAASVIGVVIVLASAIVYLFLWGKLFPYSPVIVGFIKHETTNSVVYVQKGASFDRFAELDACIPSVESFHELKFRKKPRIFIFRDRGSYLGRCLSKARFSAYSGNSLLISPWAIMVQDMYFQINRFRSERYPVDIMNTERPGSKNGNSVRPSKIDLPPIGKQRNLLRSLFGSDPDADIVYRGKVLHLRGPDIPLVAAPPHEVDKPFLPALIEEKLDACWGVFERRKRRLIGSYFSGMSSPDAEKESPARKTAIAEK